MPVRNVLKGEDKAQGASENVMLDPEGRAVLSSKNLMPNPDGVEETADGAVRFWPGFDAPPEPEGWWWYFAENSPAYKLFQRQGTRAQDIEDDYLVVSDPPTRGGPLPDVTDYAPVAAPVVDGQRTRKVANGSPQGFDGFDVPGLVELKPVNSIGYGAQEDWLVAIFWIIGNPNANRRRLLHTITCRPIRLKLPQGKGFRMPLPEEAPTGATAVGVAMCRVSQGYAGLLAQRVERIGRWMPESIALRGPFERGLAVNRQGNTSYRGSPNELPAPRIKRISWAGAVIPAGAYRWCVEEKTEFGYTASGKWSPWLHVRAASRGEAFQTQPRRRVLGSQGWRVILQYGAGGPDPDAPTFYITGEDGKTDLRIGEGAYTHTRMKTVKKKIEVPDDTPKGQDPENLRPQEKPPPSSAPQGGTGRPPNGWDAVNSRRQVVYYGDSRYMSVFEAAAREWEAVCGLKFVRGNGSGTVRVTDGDLSGSYIGMCYHYEDDSTKLVFDVARMESSSAEKRLTVALHEEGHLVGMGHATGLTLMTTSVGDASPDAPTAYDANRARKTWGPPRSGVQAMAGTKTVTVERRVPDSLKYPKASRSLQDRSGMPDPDIALTQSGDSGSLVNLVASGGSEGWTLIGDNPMTPGIKRIRYTWAVPGEIPGEDGESAPSGVVTVKVPHIGGAATHTLRVHRPPGSNEIQNSRFIKRGLDELEERWRRDPDGATGIAHVVYDGVAEHGDQNNRSDDQDVRRDEPVDVRDLAVRTVRLELSLPEHVTGRAEAHLRFLREDLNASGFPAYTEIGREAVGELGEAGEEWIERTHGPVGSGADIEWPGATTHVQRVVRHVGSDPGTGLGTGVRNLKSILENIGQRRGGVMPPKRKKSLSEPPPAISAAGVIGVADGAEDPEEEYPLGGYCAAIDNWRDSPQANVSTPLIGPLLWERDSIPDHFVVTGNISISDFDPVYGNYSLRAVGDAGVPAYISDTIESTERTRRSDRFVFKVRDLPAAGSWRLHAVHDGATDVVWLQIHSGGALRASYRDATGTVSTFLVARRIRVHDEVDVEIEVRNAGTPNARIRVWVAKQDNRRKLRLDRNADLTGIFLRDIRHGLDAPTDATTRCVIHYDHLAVMDEGSEAWTDLPGRVYEYWAPPGTPASERWGFKGCRVPISAETDYVFSYYLWFRAITEAGSPLGFSIKDSEGTVLRRVDSAAAGITGRRGWHRRWQRFTTPENAAYIEFDEGNLGDGLIRVMALQLEKGVVPTEYSNENALSGKLTVAYDLRVPGIPTNSWISGYNAIERIRFSSWVGTYEHGVTGVSLRFASAPEIIDGQEPVWSPLTPDPFEPPVGEAWMIEATLETTDPTKSPEVEDLFLDFVRRTFTVCRGDGSEYPGGAVPLDFPPIKEVPKITPTRSLDNTPGYEVSGKKTPEASGWGIGMFYDEGVEMFYGDLGEGPAGDSTIWIEDLGYRTIVEVLDADFSEVDRTRNVEVSGYRPLPSGSTYEPGAYEFAANGLTGVIRRRIAL